MPTIPESTVKELTALRAALAARDAVIAKLVRVCKAQQRLLVAYRTGSQPSEKTLDECGKASAVIAEAERTVRQ